MVYTIIRIIIQIWLCIVCAIGQKYYIVHNPLVYMESYEVSIIGGGPAGLTTALYTSRLGHSTIVIDKGGGRCAMMADTHNVIGVTEETSGIEFLQTSKQQVTDHGGTLRQDSVEEIEKSEGEFIIHSSNSDPIKSDKVVLATGFRDKHPPSPAPRTARGLHYCLHCDAYLFIDESVYVMGHSNSAAKVAMIMLNFTDDVDLLLRGEKPIWDEDTGNQLDKHPINIIQSEISGINNGDNGWLKSIEFENGDVREYKGGFAMYGSKYNNQLAKSLGCDINNNGSVGTDDHGQTDVDGVFAVGDLTDGHNQIPVRMGQGAKAGIQLHYDLREYPKDINDSRFIEDTPSVSDIIRDSK